MDCTVTGGNVKVLAKAIHSLSRIGEELYLEPQEDGLALRSVNSSRSAYACFLFSPLFFSKYATPGPKAFRCKMAIKSVQAVFRSLSSLERSVERCHVELDEGKSRLTFTLHCKHGLLKTHNLSFQETERLQAVFDKDSCANVLRAQPRLLVDTVLHFPPSLEEVSVSMSGERVYFRNHVEEGETEQSRLMLTELGLCAEEFDLCSVGAETSVTFCLKELRGLLAFAESSGLPVSMYFNGPGSPVVVCVTDSDLEGNFVLATLSDDSNLQKQNNHTTRTTTAPPSDDFMNEDIDSYLIAMETSEVTDPPGMPPPANYSPLREEGEEDEEMDRPPNKKFRSLLFGSVLPPSCPMANKTLRNQEVLASDSEEDTEAASDSP